MRLYLSIFLGAFIVGLIGLNLFYTKTPQVGASANQCKHENAECIVNNSNHACCGGLVCVPFNQQSGNGKCHVLQVPTATPTPTNTPTPTPCVIWKGEFEQPCPDLTPSPTNEPSATLTPIPQNSQSDGQSSNPGATEASTPTCNVQFQPPVLQGFKVLGNGSLEFSWWGVPSVDHYSIVYGYSPDKLVYGQDYIAQDQTSIVLNDLRVGANVWAKVYAWRGQCPSISNELDPKVR